MKRFAQRSQERIAVEVAASVEQQVEALGGALRPVQRLGRVYAKHDGRIVLRLRMECIGAQNVRVKMRERPPAGQIGDRRHSSLQVFDPRTEGRAGAAEASNVVVGYRNLGGE